MRGHFRSYFITSQSIMRSCQLVFNLSPYIGNIKSAGSKETIHKEGGDPQDNVDRIADLIHARLSEE